MQNIIFRFTMLLFFLFLHSCATKGPTSFPEKHISEAQPGSILESAELTYKSLPGEAYVYDVYVRAVLKPRTGSLIYSMNGRLDILVQNISKQNEITLKSNGNLMGGILGERAKSIRFKCERTITAKGHPISSDCDSLGAFVAFPFVVPLPDEKVKDGYHWSVKNSKEKFGTVENGAFSVKFLMVDGKPCAELGMKASIGSIDIGANEDRKATLLNCDLGLLYHHDVKLGVDNYVDLKFKSDVSVSQGVIKERFPVELEGRWILNYSHSLFKRPERG